MNRRERRRAMKARHDKFYEGYLKHLPQIPADAPLERGQITHTIFAHDIYDKLNGGLADCTCNPTVTRYLEPRRS
jgi:hypothetical protein